MKSVNYADFDPVEIFKKQIQQMCQASFLEIKKKNQITKMLINNLNEGVNKQTKRIQSLGFNIKGLENNLTTNNQKRFDKEMKREIYNSIQDKDNYINDVVKQIMSRLNNFEQIIKNIPKKQKQFQKLEQYEASVNALDNQVRRITGYNPDKNIQFDYSVQSQKLYNNMNTLENILTQQKDELFQTNKQLQKNIQLYKVTIQQPLNTFDINLSKQNQQNEHILKARLSTYANRIKSLQFNLQNMSHQIKQRKKLSLESQRKFEEGIRNLGQGLNWMNQEIPRLQKNRMEKMQDYGNYLDEMVQKMLGETIELNKRIDQLKLNYEYEINRMKQQMQLKNKQVQNMIHRF